VKTKAAIRRSSTSTRPPVQRSPFFSKHDSHGAHASTTLQAKLRNGRKGDRFEREADAMADRVVQKRDVGALSAEVTPVRRHDLRQWRETQRQLVEEEKEQVQAKDEERLQTRGDEELQEQPTDEEEEQVQAKADDELQEQSTEEEEEQAQAKADDELQASAAAGTGQLGTVSLQINARRGLGSPLPADIRAEMESYFAADFTGLRIHTDESAAMLSRALRAQAFAHGRDIFFGAGKFNPHTRTGKHLLAHELTHTLQQGAVRAGEAGAAAATAVQYKDDETVGVRPEVLQAISLARGEIGKVNAKKTADDGTRQGWQRLHEYFNTAFEGQDVIPEAVIRQIVTVATGSGKKDAMPAWCGVFVWWAMKKAGIPLPGWKQARSVISADTRRPGAQLPQKGDIAYREKNSHFALVTGIEDAASREGKSYPAVRVATINGNTSGDDNLGGQIEEKWEPLSRWHSFFDALGVLDLPEVELVDVPVVPDEETGARDAPEPAAGTAVGQAEATAV
jgi:hypothetical protein